MTKKTQLKAFSLESVKNVYYFDQSESAYVLLKRLDL